VTIEGSIGHFKSKVAINGTEKEFEHGTVIVAIGAKEMSPLDLKSHIDKKTKMLIIDVREPEAFTKETIPGAINIPIGQLERRLHDIPKDTLLAFT
jgi:3-mercaptopyruvate sulfurtransferase SseA